MSMHRTSSFKEYSPIEIKDILSLECGAAGREIILVKKSFRVTDIDKSEVSENIWDIFIITKKL